MELVGGLKLVWAAKLFLLLVSEVYGLHSCEEEGVSMGVLLVTVLISLTLWGMVSVLLKQLKNVH